MSQLWTVPKKGLTSHGGNEISFALSLKGPDGLVQPDGNPTWHNKNGTQMPNLRQGESIDEKYEWKFQSTLSKTFS